MVNRKKIFFLIIFTAFLLLSFAIFTFAGELEVKYPDVPNVVAPRTTKAFLPSYVHYIFNLAIIISGLVAFASLVYGGFRYLTSAGSPVAISDAKAQITAGLLGLVLLLGSYLLLTTINPQLVILKVGKEEYCKGVILFKDIPRTDGSCPLEVDPDKCAPTEGQEGEHYEFYRTSSSTLRDFRGEHDEIDVKSIYFFNGAEDLEVNLYTGESYQPYDTALIFKDHSAGDCRPVDINAHSISLNWKTPGVYLCNKELTPGATSCTGEELVYPGSIATLEEFDNNVLGIRFRDKTKCCKTACWEHPESCGQADECKCTPADCNTDLTCKMPLVLYGAVLHEHPNYQGDCEVFLDYAEDLNNASCANSGSGPFCVPDQEIKGRTSSITVFHQVFGSHLNWQEGDGVTLYADYDFNEQEDGKQRDDCGDQGGEGCICKPIPPLTPNPLWIEPGGGLAEYPGSNCNVILGAVPGDDENLYPRASSIKVQGNFMAVVFRNDGRCEVFQASDVRLKNNHIGDDQIKYLLILPAIAPGTE